MHETFWTLLRDAAHWEFEIFLTILTEAATAGIGWLFVRKHWRHHIARDVRDTTYGRGLGERAQNTLALAQQNMLDSSPRIQTPEGICEDCGGTKAALDGVDFCLGCGDMRVQHRAGKTFLVPSDNGDNGWPSWE